MKKLRSLILPIVLLFIAVITIPTVIVSLSNDKKVEVTNEDSQNELASVFDEGAAITVFRSATNTTESIPLEQYVIGVVASEMPADFELEALKAQALSARTYIVKAKLHADPDAENHITDTVLHQVYKSNDELRAIWGQNYEKNMNKIKTAVKETAGQILTYDDEPITASYFSTSNGRTENSEDYWSGALPYLKSVDSSWDIDTPKYITEIEMPVSEVEEKLGVKLPDQKEIGKVLERTAGNRIAKIEVNGKTFTGKEVREKLELRSSDFEWTRNGNQVMIQTKGFGHGVGMSQYGANGMAQEGHDYKEILAHYYQGTTIAEASTFLATMTAKK